MKATITTTRTLDADSLEHAETLAAMARRDAEPDAVVTSHVTYRFEELSLDAQEHALDLLRERAASWLEPWQLEDTDYWQERFLDPVGATFQTHRVPLMSGKTREEPAVYWDAYPWSAYFIADVDVETFLLAHKLGRSHRLLLSAIRRGDIHESASVGEHSRRGYHDWHASLETIAYDGDDDSRWERLDAQIRDLEERIDDWYLETAGEIASCLRSQEEWLTSEERAREDAIDLAMEFFADGSLA